MIINLKLVAMGLFAVLVVLLYLDTTSAYDECVSRGLTGDDLSECVWLLENN